MPTIPKEVINIAVLKAVDRACSVMSDKGLEGQRISDREKEGVKGLVCESVSFVASVLVERDISAVDAGVHMINNGVNMGKLTPSQQVYCKALIAEMAVHGGLLAGEVSATYAAAVAGGHAGVVAGGITGTVVAGPAGTAVGAAAGVAVGAGVPLAIGAYKFLERAAQITNTAVEYHSQCGPLAMSKASPAPRTLIAP